MSFFGRDGREHFSVPTRATEVFDVSGAGDTVVAAFALAIASHLNHGEAVRLANAAAGRVVAKFGTATVTLDELMLDDVPAARLVAREKLAQLAAHLRGEGRRIATINGTFDVLHAGHLRILTEAREQADVLIVGLNSDVSVRSLKGPSRPIVPEQQRADLLLGLRCVDYVHVFDEATPIPFLEQVQPDVHVNGLEYGPNCVEAPTVRRFGGRLHLVPRTLGLSTTSILEAIERRDSSVA
jgi:D-beta-D-heptose 7-phosphate kinase/D-beta-D-heptose 1-phosphate adenosyltransferase